MKYLLVILVLLTFKSYSQNKISIIFNNRETEIKEIEIFNNEIVTIKNVYTFISTNDLHKQISTVTELLKKYDLKNCTFYFIRIKPTLSKQEKEQKVLEALKFIQSQKMLLESDLYTVSDGDHLGSYIKTKISNDKKIDNLDIDSKFDGYLIEIKENLQLNDMKVVKKHIIDNK